MEENYEDINIYELDGLIEFLKDKSVQPYIFFLLGLYEGQTFFEMILIKFGFVEYAELRISKRIARKITLALKFTEDMIKENSIELIEKPRQTNPNN